MSLSVKIFLSLALILLCVASSNSVGDISPSVCPLPIFDPVPPYSPSYVSPTGSSPSEAPPLQTYSRRPRAPPPPASSLDPGSGTASFPSSPRYPSRIRGPPNRYGWLSSTNHPFPSPYLMLVFQILTVPFLGSLTRSLFLARSLKLFRILIGFKLCKQR